jgi:lambda repressor-like predicted transcriptional regulator
MKGKLVICRLYKKGLTLSEIAKQSGLSTTHVGTVLHNMGLRQRSTREQKLPDDALQIFLSRRDEGKTLQKIGDEFGVTRERVRQVLLTGKSRCRADVKSLLKEKGIGIVALSKIAGVRHDALLRVINGYSKTVRVRCLISLILNMPVADLWDDAPTSKEILTKTELLAPAGMVKSKRQRT